MHGPQEGKGERERCYGHSARTCPTRSHALTFTILYRKMADGRTDGALTTPDADEAHRRLRGPFGSEAMGFSGRMNMYVGARTQSQNS